MLFNSFIFLFAFLPFALLATWSVRRWTTASRLVVTLLSLGFYAWWNPAQLPILLSSIVFNYWVGDQIQKARAAEKSTPLRVWLTIGVVVDLAMLGWFKYANFVVDNLNLLGANIHLARIALPLAISFFTFQKLAYLIDSARGEAKPMKALDFFLFASFFPQLIAGPIVHYKEVVPQFVSRRFARLGGRALLPGLVIFSMGLFKKTVLADTLAQFSDPMFNKAIPMGHLGPIGGWIAAMTFTFQLYFDFSGYSDMAIGLGRMFGIKLPLNFHSPLRAASIIEYWRRWHMTLQRFVYAYIFQPLTVPLTRFAAMRGFAPWPSFAVAVAFPLFVTFVAVGIWHGAGWTYVLFGVMHAIYVCVNQFWRERRNQRRRKLRRQNRKMTEPGRLATIGYQALTLVAVIFGNVMFRARSVDDAVRVWRGMTGLRADTWSLGSLDPGLMVMLAISGAIVFLAPNTQQIMRRFDPALNWKEWRSVAPPAIDWVWKPSLPGLVFAATALMFGVLFIERGRAVFLYFNF